MRIGHGFDVHAFGGEGPIIIGGVRIPYEKGLLAHSDGDVALHALTDALLGAAALGDIGKLFPDTDPAFKGADSRELLREAWRRIQAKGYALGNVDVTIIAPDPWSKIRQCYFSFHHFKYGIRLFGFRRLAAAGRTAFPA